MFGRPRPVTFNPYGRRRSRRRLPPWLVLLLGGIGVGAAGVVVVQQRYLPPRLSAEASVALRNAFERAEAERLRLKAELDQASKRLAAAIAEKQVQSDELALSRTTAEQLRDDVRSAVDSLPPDPRGGSVEVRAARFTAKGGVLAYDVVLTRARTTPKPMDGVVQFVVTGESARGADTAVTLKPIATSLGGQQIVRGSVPLPEGFRPRQTTIQVLDRPGGRLLGMRVILIKPAS
jgi:hypothetical protein